MSLSCLGHAPLCAGVQDEKVAEVASSHVAVVAVLLSRSMYLTPPTVYLQAQDEKLAELKRKLAAAKPAFAMAGAGGDNGGAPSLEQLFSGLGSGKMLAAGPAGGYGSSMAEAAVSASALPASWPLDAPRGGSSASRLELVHISRLRAFLQCVGMLVAHQARRSQLRGICRVARCKPGCCRWLTARLHALDEHVRRACSGNDAFLHAFLHEAPQQLESATQAFI